MIRVRKISMMVLSALIPLSADAMIRGSRYRNWRETVRASLDELEPIPIALIMADREKPIYCSELDCYELQTECSLHNPRNIFSRYMLNKGKRNNESAIYEPVLPMMPQELRHIIGGYAQESPEQYEIASYCQNPPPYAISLWRDQLSLPGSLAMNADNTAVVLSDVYKATNTHTIVLAAAAEANLFKDVLEPKNDVAFSITWEDLPFSDRLLRLLVRKTVFSRGIEYQDLFYLKPFSEDNEALKAAGFLPKK